MPCLGKEWPEAVELAAGARSEQAKAEELSRGAAKRLRQAARRLVHIDGLSLRGAAAVLGVTFGPGAANC
ncbi:MAG: hypothetical protein ACRDST_05065 [Pseudonocardiaceae bacterium]